MIKRLLKLFCAITIVGTPSIVMAQVAEFTLISPDTRTVAMGASSTAIVSNAFGFFNNSASLVFSPKDGSVSTSYGSWLPSTLDKTVVAGAGFVKMGKRSVISFGYNNFLNKDIIISDEFGNRVSYFTPKEYVFGAGFSYLIGNNLSISTNLKFISSDLGGSSVGTAVAGDLSFFYKKNHLNLGVKLSNLGTAIDYGNGPYKLPENLRIGGAMEKDFSERSLVIFTAEAGVLFEQSAFTAGVGIEYSHNNSLFLRTGAHYGDKTKSTPPYFSLGAGVLLFGINLDIAYLIAENDSPLSNSFSVAVGWSF